MNAMYAPYLPKIQFAQVPHKRNQIFLIDEPVEHFSDS